MKLRDSEETIMQGKKVVITGANGGLGSAVTNTFLNAGATVAGVSLDIRQDSFAGPNFFAFATELADSKRVAQLAQDVIARLGQVDVLIHLAGGFAGGKPVTETDDATFENMLNMNLRSSFMVFRAFLPIMRKTPGGRIVAMGSRAAEGAAPGIGAYGLSKAALISLVRTVAAENKDVGITANVVVPSTIDTPANRASMPDADPNRWIKPQIIADLIFYLAGDSAAQLTGAVIPLYGRDV